MEAQITAILEAIKATTTHDAEAFRLQYLSKKGVLGLLFDDFKQVPNDQKRTIGAQLNALRQAAEAKHADLQAASAPTAPATSAPAADLTLPPPAWAAGGTHPLSMVRHQITDIFQRIGFNVSDGNEITDDWHNFEALNFEPHHPARDMQDTFFVRPPNVDLPPHLLRTHTSSVQVKEMQKGLLPIRTISPGRVYRNETISARAHCLFHQIEGLYVAHDASFAQLKQTLYHFAKEMFGEKVQVRFRPSYFPFTEPSAEMDVSCFICDSKGCNVCKHSGWVEILGCGMVHPQVLQNCGIDANIYNGYAFGMGIERIAMLKYQINDLRLFYENDLRFLQQFH
jgi:phenylalanyl-tRNA synthetase alpha chain